MPMKKERKELSSEFVESLKSKLQSLGFEDAGLSKRGRPRLLNSNYKLDKCDDTFNISVVIGNRGVQVFYNDDRVMSYHMPDNENIDHDVELFTRDMNSFTSSYLKRKLKNQNQAEGIGCNTDKPIKSGCGHNHLPALRTDVRRYLGGLPNVYKCTQESAYNRKLMEYVAYTDGACDNISPLKPGGSAYVIMKEGNIVRARNHGCINTSNNRMELLAIVSAATFTPERSCLDIYTDSQYCINVLTGKWSATANTDLVEKFKMAAKNLKSVVFHWVKGHSGDVYNEMVDDMAYSAYMEQVEKYGLQPNVYAKGGVKKRSKRSKSIIR